MHEMSIAHGLVEAVTEATVARGGVRVTRVKVRIGCVSGVVPEALAFAYEVAIDGTMLDGSVLEIERVPLTLSCGTCGESACEDGAPQFVCPSCGDLAAVLHGRELELIEMEIDDEPAATPVGSLV